jgi:hypothetical protein
MVKKTRKQSRRHRRRTLKHRRRRGGAIAGNSMPLIPPSNAFDHSTAGSNTDNEIGYAPKK